MIPTAPPQPPTKSDTTALVLRRGSRKPAASKDKPPKPAARAKLVLRKRDGQDSRLYNLKLDINDIKQEIAQLTMMRTIVQAQTLNRQDEMDGSCQKMVVDYFRVFEKGFAASQYDPVSYIYHAMSEDVQVNNFAGRAMILEQWKIHSATFKDLQFRFIGATVIPLSESRTLVKCTAHFREAVTLATLSMMFPHILHRHDIVDKLVDKSISGFGQYNFEIDLTNRQITRCDVVLDYFSCFARLLPDARELAVLFGQALVVDEFYIREAEEVIEPIPTEPSRSSISEILASEDEANGGDTQAVALTASPYEEDPMPTSTRRSSTPAQSKMSLSSILNDDEATETETIATSQYAGDAF